MTHFSNKPLILVSAGESSSDLHGAAVLRNLSKRCKLRIKGIGGEELGSLGAELIDSSDVSGTMGFGSMFPSILKHVKLLSSMYRIAKHERPDAALLVDYGGFNLPLLFILNVLKIPTVFHMCPKVWAWGRFRAKLISRWATRIITVFPFEHSFYRRYGASAVYTGHPLYDIINENYPDESITESNNIPKDLKTVNDRYDRKNILMLMPGSRRSELDSLFPSMLSATAQWLKKHPDWNVVIPAAPGIEPSLLQKYIKAGALNSESVSIVPSEDRYVWMKRASLAVTASGTATLECMILNTPMVVVYKVDSLSASIARLLVKLENYSLPNIIAGRRIVPELMQEKFRPGRIYKSMEWVYHNRKLILKSFEKSLSRNHKGRSGALNRASDVLQDVLKGRL